MFGLGSLNFRNTLAVSCVLLAVTVAFLQNANSKLKQENLTLSATIQQQEAVNQQLQQAVEFERESAKEQKAITDEIQRKANKAVRNVQAVIKNAPCANTRLDDVVIEQLQQQSNR